MNVKEPEQVIIVKDIRVPDKTANARRLLAQAKPEEIPVLARLFKSVMIEDQDFEAAAYFRDIENAFTRPQAVRITLSIEA